MHVDALYSNITVIQNYIYHCTYKEEQNIKCCNLCTVKINAFIKISLLHYSTYITSIYSINL